jgi:hypothetical protein
VPLQPTKALSVAAAAPAPLLAGHQQVSACCCGVWLQDIGEDLVSLLHYRERGQLVAVTSTGSAVILSQGSNSSSSSTTTTTSSSKADTWGVLLRMKITNAASGSGLQVCSTAVTGYPGLALTNCNTWHLQQLLLCACDP